MNQATWGKMQKGPRAPSPELALLLACTRVHMRAEDLTAANAAIRRGIDWDTLLRLADRHGVLPLLHHHYAARILSSATIPEQALTSLRRGATSSAHRSLYLAGELVALLHEFAAHDIKVVPLKGPILAQCIYGSIALRGINDLDLLFSELDLSRATTLLQALGYQPDRSYPSTSDDMMHRTLHHISLIAPSGTYRIELHVHLHPPTTRKRYGMNTIAAHLQKSSFLGTSVPVLPAEELLVYLCLHGAGHAWYRLEWICGVAELLRGAQIQDWARVREYASRFDGRRRVGAALLIAHALLDAPVPDDMLHGDSWTYAAAASVIDLLISAPDRVQGRMELLLYQLRTDAGPAVRLQRCWITFIRPAVADTVAMPLPRALWPLYYVLRPIRLSLKYGRRLILGKTPTATFTSHITAAIPLDLPTSLL